MVVYPARLSAQRITEHRVSYLTERKNGFLYTVATVEARLEVGCHGLGYSLQAHVFDSGVVNLWLTYVALTRGQVKHTNFQVNKYPKYS